MVGWDQSISDSVLKFGNGSDKIALLVEHRHHLFILDFDVEGCDWGDECRVTEFLHVFEVLFGKSAVNAAVVHDNDYDWEMIADLKNIKTKKCS